MSSTTSDPASEESSRRRDENLGRLREALKNKSLVIVVGAGVTLSATSDTAGNPLQRLTWTGLIRNGLDYLIEEGHVDPSNPRTKRAYKSLEDDDPDSLLDAASIMASQMRQNRQFATWLRSVFGNLYGEVRHPAILEVLKAFSEEGATLLTTNYDDLLERKCNLQHIGRSDRDEILKFKCGDLGGVFHVHGSYLDPHEVVLDTTDYYKVTQSDEVQNLLKTYMEYKTILFVGCGSGLEDPNFSALLKWAGDRHENIPNRHCLLVRDGDSLNHKMLLRLRYGPEYRDLAPYLCRLLDISAPTAAVSRLPNGESSAAELAKDEKDCLQSLSFVDMETRQHAIARALSNTSMWIFDKPEFRDWLERKTLGRHHGVLWVKGKPGSGKSVLMKQMLTRTQACQPSSCIISFFFNARGSPSEKTPLGLFRSLTHQLFRQRRELLITFLPKFRAKRDMFRPGWEWQEGELREVFEDIVQTGQVSSIIVFIDALDECEPESKVRPLVTFFANLTSSSKCKLNICMSSRHYPHISVPGCREITMETWNAPDIYKYVQSELYFGDSAGRTFQKDVADKAAGVFLWVVLVVTSLRQSRDEGRTVAEMQQILRSVPHELDELFTKYFKAINPGDRHKTLNLMLCILFSRRPLTPMEVSCALAFGSDDPPRSQQSWQQSGSYLGDDDYIERLLRTISKGLVEVKEAQYGNEDATNYDIFRHIDPERRVVQFIHESVRGFLLHSDGLRIIDPGIGQLASGKAHHLMTKACLGYLSVEELQECSVTKKDLLYEPLPHSTKHAVEVVRRYMQHDFWEYAVDSLFAHAAEAEAAEVAQSHLAVAFRAQPTIFDVWNYFHDVLKVADYKAKNGAGTTFLHIASQYGLLTCVANLLSWGTNVNTEGGRSRFALIAAASRGCKEIVELLLKHGAEKDAKDEDGETPLHRAAEGGHTTTALLLLEKGVAANVRNTNGGTALHKTAKASLNAEALIELLTEKGADINAKDNKGVTPLYQAAEQGKTETMRLFLEKGADASLKDNEGVTPLHRAAGAWRNSREMVQLLLRKGVDITVKDKKGMTVLHRAAERGNAEAIRLLLEKGADASLKENEGVTPLHRAASTSRGSRDGVQLLLGKGVDITAKDKEGITALHRAVEKGNTEIIRLLLEKGADASLKDNEGVNPLHRAVSTSRGSREMVRLLLGKGGDITVKDKKGITVLHRAAERGNAETIRLLLENGADASLKDDEGITPLHRAAKCGHEAIVRFLLDQGADAAAKDKDGVTALYWAAEREHDAMVKLLLKQGANAEMKDKNGAMVLHWAVERGHEAIVRFLLDQGADATAKDKNGVTVLHRAVKRGRKATVQTLLENLFKSSESMIYEDFEFERLSNTLTRWYIGGTWYYVSSKTRLLTREEI